MTNPTNPKRIDLPNGCWWQDLTDKGTPRIHHKGVGQIYDATGHAVVINVTRFMAGRLAAAMQPAQPSADAVESDNTSFNKGYYAGQEDTEEILNARVAELTQRNAELERETEYLWDVIKKISPNIPKADKTCVEPGISFYEAVRREWQSLASQGGNGGAVSMELALIAFVLYVGWFLNSDDMDAFMWRIGRGHKDFNAEKFALRKSSWRTWRDEVKARKKNQKKTKS